MTTTWYANAQCSGTPLTSQTFDLTNEPIPLQNDDQNTQFYCVKYQCSSSSDLPLPNTYYNIDQYYINGVEGSCTGSPLRFDAVINNKCFGIPNDQEYYDFYQYEFPLQVKYGSVYDGVCSSVVTNISLPSGCFTNMNSVTTMIDESSSQSLMFHPDGGFLSSNDVGKQLHARTAQTASPKQASRGQRDLGVFYYDDNIAQYEGHSFTLLGSSSSSSSSSLSTGAIVGIAIGSIAIVVFIAVVVGLFITGRIGASSGKKQADNNNTSSDMELGTNNVIHKQDNPIHLK